MTKQRDVVELFDGDKGYEITYKGTTTQDPTEMQDYLAPPRSFSGVGCPEVAAFLQDHDPL